MRNKKRGTSKYAPHIPGIVKNRMLSLLLLLFLCITFHDLHHYGCDAL